MSTLDPSSCYLTVANRSRIDIIDIRNEKTVSNLKDDVASISEIKNGSRQLPTLLLYDKLGLQLFERVCLSPPLPRDNLHLEGRLMRPMTAAPLCCADHLLG